MCQHQCSKIAVWQLCGERLCGTVMMAWIWHVWINAIVFVPTAKAPPKAGAKELSYNSLNLAYSGQHPCFGPNWFIQFCHTWRWIRYAGMPRKSLPRKQAKVDTGNSVFLLLRKQGPSPRAIFKWKTFIEQLKLLLKWMLIERWRRQRMFNVPTCAGVDTNMWALLGSQGANPDSVSSKWPGCLFAPWMSRTTIMCDGTVYWNLLCLFRGAGGFPALL